MAEQARPIKGQKQKYLPLKLLFTTTSNLASNPRLYKEIILARSLNFEVEVICFEFQNWSFDYNLQLLQSIGECKVHIISANRSPFIPWMKSVASEKAYRMLGRMVGLSGKMLSQSVSRRSNLIVQTLKEIRGDFDWVIAHNPGAFYPALWFSRRRKIRLGIDLEDYHPGESNNPLAAERMRKLLKMIIPEADYITAASPLILSESLKVAQPNCDPSVVLNYFPKAEFVPPQQVMGDNLRLIWFSQHISFGRGLEQLIPVIERLENIELHLFGNCNDLFYAEWLEDRKNVFIHESLTQQQLHQKLSEFDVGLALENVLSDYNRTLCITNKILAYFQSGLYIIASDTLAQQDFMANHPEHGAIISLDKEHLQRQIDELLHKKENIRSRRSERYLRAATCNWESESEKIVKLWLSPRSDARSGR